MYFELGSDSVLVQHRENTRNYRLWRLLHTGRCGQPTWANIHPRLGRPPASAADGGTKHDVAGITEIVGVRRSANGTRTHTERRGEVNQASLVIDVQPRAPHHSCGLAEAGARQ